MMIHEFRQRLEHLTAEEWSIPQEEYKTIEYVYTYHPVFDTDIDPKTKAARLYIDGGIRLFKDMIPTAKKAEELEKEIRSLRAALDSKKAEFEKLKH